jgi:RNA polymerase sigma factor (sigma-70 family)
MQSVRQPFRVSEALSAICFLFLLGEATKEEKGLRFAMDQDNRHVEPDQGGLLLTPWTQVLKAAQSQTPGASQAWAHLWKLYRPPLYAVARYRGRSHEDAEDSVQGFFERLLASRALATVDRSKGRFRSFLFASFENHMAEEARKARAARRGGGRVISLESLDPIDRKRVEPKDPITPETLFTAEWALSLLRRATDCLRQEYETTGKCVTFHALKGFLGGGDGGGPTPLTYEEAARALGIPVSDVTNRIHRLRRRHTQLVHKEVERTVSDPAEVDAELHELREALALARRVQP